MSGALDQQPIRNIGGYSKKDRALSRRFQKVDVLEPSVEETVEITCRGLKTEFEKYHSVRYTAPALRTAAELSVAVYQ